MIDLLCSPISTDQSSSCVQLTPQPCALHHPNTLAAIWETRQHARQCGVSCKFHSDRRSQKPNNGHSSSNEEPTAQKATCLPQQQNHMAPVSCVWAKTQQSALWGQKESEEVHKMSLMQCGIKFRGQDHLPFSLRNLPLKSQSSMIRSLP